MKNLIHNKARKTLHFLRWQRRHLHIPKHHTDMGGMGPRMSEDLVCAEAPASSQSFLAVDTLGIGSRCLLCYGSDLGDDQ